MKTKRDEYCNWSCQGTINIGHDISEHDKCWPHISMQIKQTESREYQMGR